MSERLIRPSVRVDFQNADPDGRVRLNTVSSFADIERQRIELKPGLWLLLVDAELSAAGRVAWNEDEQLWVAEVDWNDLIEPSSPERVRGYPGTLAHGEVVFYECAVRVRLRP